MALLLRKTNSRWLENIRKFKLTRNLSLQSDTIKNENSGNKPCQHFDVIIAGGGLVGTAFACAISKNKALSDKKVLLLEGGKPFKKFDDEGEYRNRVSAINQKSIELFKSIDAWERISKSRVKPVKRMHVWDACSDAVITFSKENFSSEVAYIIENDLILDAIYNQLEKAPNVVIKNMSRIDSVKLPNNDTNKSQVTLVNGDETITCELLVGADGVNSIVRKEMGVDVFSLNYDAMAVVATLELPADLKDNSTAWQRFIPTGPIALLPLSDTKSSLVWSTSKLHAKKLVAMPEDQFVDAVNEAYLMEYPKNDVVVSAMRCLNAIMGNNQDILRQYPPKVQNVIEKSRACFPLGFLHASSYVTQGAALIGDAAHRIHPLAGQGVNLGFSDVRYLTEALSEAVYAGAKLNNSQYLRQYEQNSLANNVPLMLGVHGLQTIYSTTFSPLVLLRSLGLQLTQNIPPIKNLFMKRAIG